MALPRLYGVVRSGSTLVHNVLEMIYGEKIIKAHSFFEDAGDAKIVLTYRDFRDSAASEWRVFEANFDELEDLKQVDFEGIKKHLLRKKYSVEDMRKFKRAYDANQLLFLKYEEFHGNLDFLIDSLENFLDISVVKRKREAIKIETDIQTRKKQSKKLETFSNYDRDTYLHGKHILSGEVGTWRRIVKKRDWEKINKYLEEELLEWGYKI